MRYESAGESHGKALAAIVYDVPAGVRICTADIDAEMARRQMGYGRGGRMSIERDHAEILSGVRFSKTLGTPVALEIANRDHENWIGRMDVDGDAPEDLVLERTPRPGHADLVGAMKIGTDDCRDILERASARETACRVAAGAVAKAFLREVGVEIGSYVERIGHVCLPEGYGSDRGYVFDNSRVDLSETRCPDAFTTEAMKDVIDAARSDGQSLGGWFRVTATGLVPGIGSYSRTADRLTSRLGAALFSIPAIKGVEFGMGFLAGELPGGNVHDPIAHDPARGFFRKSNNAGGLEGGMANGEPLLIRACMKPIPTLTSPLATVDLDTLEPAEASRERSDVCAVPAAAVVAEAEVALVLATAYQDKFGKDCVDDILGAIDAYRRRIR